MKNPKNTPSEQIDKTPLSKEELLNFQMQNIKEEFSKLQGREPME